MGERMGIYPIMVKMQGVRCLVVGGGRVAERKIKRLLEVDALVSLIAREVTPWLEEAVFQGKVTFLSRDYHPLHLEGVRMVFAVTNDQALNNQVTKDALARGLWCNSATNPSEGNIFLPASLINGHLIISVSTSGASPAMAQLIRDEIASSFGTATWKTTIACLERARKYLQERTTLSDDDKQNLLRTMASVMFRFARNSSRGKR